MIRKPNTTTGVHCGPKPGVGELLDATDDDAPEHRHGRCRSTHDAAVKAIRPASKPWKYQIVVS